MPEIRTTQVQQADQRCPKCNKGYMRPTGIVKTTNPPQYEHACTICGHKQDYGVRYPYNIPQ